MQTEGRLVEVMNEKAHKLKKFPISIHIHKFRLETKENPLKTQQCLK